jgi:hypothetical protein
MSDREPLDSMGMAAAVEFIEAEAWAQLQLALPAELRIRLGVQVRRHGRAVSLLAPGADVPAINRTFGLGFEQPLTPGQLDGIITDYAAAATKRWMLLWCPSAMPSSADEMIVARGARAVTPLLKMWRATDDTVVVTQPTTCTVVEIGVDDAPTFEAVVAEPLGVPPDVGPGIRSTVGHPGWHYYLALDGARPIAGAAMYVRGDGAWFGFGATNVADRGRGAQTALLSRRLRDAATLGCEWISAETYPDTAERPNPSYRNMVRMGMRVLYRRTSYLFETATDGRGR